jgi:hypothetical protein
LGEKSVLNARHAPLQHVGGVLIALQASDFAAQRSHGFNHPALLRGEFVNPFIQSRTQTVYALVQSVTQTLDALVQPFPQAIDSPIQSLTDRIDTAVGIGETGFKALLTLLQPSDGFRDFRNDGLSSSSIELGIAPPVMPADHSRDFTRGLGSVKCRCPPRNYNKRSNPKTWDLIPGTR